ncbi:MAG: OmpH family outer membrane protein [Bacteroides sp.]|nr:OmpH family outer membrane protein [Roseburia sp.]MCM1346094.1 OmpH family outer membrane protein [Bacteroides sp.]MCM1420412.1 OmpH family outer membrane protein [Bacteroides sp.]
MKKIFLILATVLTTTMSVAQTESGPSMDVLSETPAAIVREQHFGYLSYSEALKAMPGYNEAQKSLEALKADYDKELERAEQEFTKKFNEFVDGQKSFPENILLKRQKELQVLMEQSIKFKDESQRLLTKAEKELMQPLVDRLSGILQKIGTERNYDYILNTDSNAYPFVNVNRGDDIMEVVISNIE